MLSPHNFIAEYNQIKHELNNKLKQIFDRGQFILGFEVSNFEKEYARYTGTKYCIGVANGLDAIFLALKAFGVGKGDEVIVPSNTYIATALAVSHTGAKPILVEPDIQTYNINPDNIVKEINSKTKAIIPVHLYGLCADMEKINNIAKQYNLHVVEDAAQAHGASINEKKAGSFGDAAAFSFYPTKNLGCYGDGGCVTTNNEEIYKKLLLLRNYGSSKKFQNDIIGYNSRLDEIQAGILRIKLQYLDIWNAKRREAVKEFKNQFNNRNFIWPTEPKNYKHVYHQLIIRTKNRDKEIKNLSKMGYKCQIHYPIPPYKSSAYQSDYQQLSFPVADELSDTVISLPIHGCIWNTIEKNYEIENGQ